MFLHIKEKREKDGDGWRGVGFEKLHALKVGNLRHTGYLEFRNRLEAFEAPAAASDSCKTFAFQQTYMFIVRKEAI